MTLVGMGLFCGWVATKYYGYETAVLCSTPPISSAFDIVSPSFKVSGGRGNVNNVAYQGLSTCIGCESNPMVGLGILLRRGPSNTKFRVRSLHSFGTWFLTSPLWHIVLVGTSSLTVDIDH